MFEPIKEYDFIAFTVLYISFEEMSFRLKQLLLEASEENEDELPWQFRVGKLDMHYILRDGQTLSGRINRRIAIWPIKEGENRTIFLSNLRDGCTTTIDALKKPIARINIAVSKDSRKNYFSSFEFIVKDYERLIQVMWDSTRWVFFEKGVMMPFENPEYYKRRVKRERLNYSIINEYLEANGWFLNDESSWHSDTAAFFTENHPKKINEW